MNWRATARIACEYGASLVLLVVLWALVVRLFDVPQFLLPAPSAVFRTLVSESGSFATAACATFGNMALGAALGVSLGAMTGFGVAYSKTARWLFEPYLTLFQSFPREALFPLLVVWLGFGAAPKIVNAALLSFFPMAVVTLSALTDTRDDYIRLIQTWKASKSEEFFHCRLPAAVPALFGGLKIALPLALIGAVLGEFLGGNEGLGYIIISSGSAFRTDRVFAAIIVLGCGGVLLLAAINTIQRLHFRRFFQV